MTPEQKVYDGERAKNVLENEAFQQVFTDIETELVDKWKSSSSAADREKMHQYLQVLGMIQRRLMDTFETGKLAHADLTHKRSLTERLSGKLETWLHSEPY